jgi:hypothetical protein
LGVLPKRLKGTVSDSHIRSKAQEKETAKRTGGEQTPRSGAGLVKGDVRAKGVLRVENKTTKYASFSVTTLHIDKLLDSVNGTDEVPFMQVELQGGHRKFVVIPDEYWDDVIKALNDKTN